MFECAFIKNDACEVTAVMGKKRLKNRKSFMDKTTDIHITITNAQYYFIDKYKLSPSKILQGVLNQMIEHQKEKEQG